MSPASQISLIFPRTVLTHVTTSLSTTLFSARHGAQTAGRSGSVSPVHCRPNTLTTTLPLHTFDAIYPIHNSSILCAGHTAHRVTITPLPKLGRRSLFQLSFFGHSPHANSPIGDEHGNYEINDPLSNFALLEIYEISDLRESLHAP